MKQRKLFSALRLLPFLLLMALLGTLSLENAGRAGSLLRQHTVSTAAEFTQELDGYLGDGFSRKHDFLELNGAMTKALGIHTLNDRQKLASGALAYFPNPTADPYLPAKIAQLQQFVLAQGAGFLCVPMALKEESFAGTPAPGYASGHKAMEQFYAMAQEQGIQFLNMEAWFQEQGWGLTDIYFNTDHHWRSEAAFAAMVQIMRWYEENQGLTLEESTLDLNNWNVEVFEDWFLGSEGKRTSAAFAGVDDFHLLSPRFPTDYTVGRVRIGRQPNLDNPHSVYDRSHLARKDWYALDCHSAYLGGDFPYAYIENSLAVNDQTLVVIGDSFRTQPEVFLSTQFTRIYHIDLRYYEDGTLPEFLRQIQPDQVLLLFCSPQDLLTHNYQLPQWEEHWAGKSPADPLWTQEELVITQERFTLLQANLAPGAYELALEQTQLTSSQADPGIFLEAALMDLTTGTIRQARYFLANEDQPQRWLFTVPEDAHANYAVVLFGGMQGHTQGNTAAIQGLALRPYR